MIEKHCDTTEASEGNKLHGLIALIICLYAGYLLVKLIISIWAIVIATATILFFLAELSAIVYLFVMREKKIPKN